MSNNSNALDDDGDEEFVKTSTNITSEMSNLIQFGSLFTHTIGSLNTNVNRMQHSYDKTHQALIRLRELTENQGSILSKLQIDVADQRMRSQELMRNAMTMDFSKNRENENQGTRSATKLDVNSSRSRLSMAMNDAIFKFGSHANKIGVEHIPMPGQVTNADMFRAVSKRLAQIESALEHQTDVNQHIGAAITADDTWSKAYDTFSEQLSKLDEEMNSYKTENESLKTTIKDLKEDFQRDLKKTKEDKDMQGIRIGKRKKRTKPIPLTFNNGDKSGLGVDPASVGNEYPETTPNNNIAEEVEYITANMDAYTLEESDILAERISALEAALVEQKAATLSLFKNIKGDLEDVNIDIQTVKNKLSLIIGAQEDEGEDDTSGSVQLGKQIQSCKLMWIKLQDEIGYGLDAIEENFKDGGVEKSTYEALRASPFISKCHSLLETFDELILAFEPKDNVTETLVQLYPKLDAITLAVSKLLELDAESKASVEVKPTLDDIPMSDRSVSLRKKLNDICELSFPLLDQLIDKVSMKRRIEKLEVQISHKTEKSTVEQLEHEIRVMLSGKTDQLEFLDIARSKASMAEMLHLKDQLFKQIDFLRNANVGTISIGGSGDKGGGVAAIANAASTEVTNELTKRFDLIFDHFQDLQRYCTNFVPRDEVELAMKALLNEVKHIKLNGVTPSVFKEGLKLKADADEMHRLITSLTNVVGSLQGKNTSAAVHAKCLMCDKPVNSMHYKHSASLNQLEEQDESFFRPATSGARLGGQQPSRSISPPMSLKEKAKVTTEFTVMRSSVDLPPISNNDPQEDSLTSKPVPKSFSPAGYKQRIRSSGGGGYVA